MVYIYDLNFFRKVNNAYGSKSKKETTLYEIKRDLENSYEPLTDYQPDAIVDGISMPLLVMEYQGSRAEKNRYKKIEAPPGSTFNLGSKIDCFGQKWLVTDINYNQELKLSGQMQLCNYLLLFQDDKGYVYEEDCVESTYQINSTGLDKNKIITTNSTLKHLLVQYNSNVLHLYQGKRLFIDLRGVPNPKVYEITNINRTTNMYNGYGFFDLTCDERVLQPEDRPDLMIADYVEPPLPSPTPIGSCEIIYSGEPILKIGGSAKRFTAIFKDNDGNPITTIIPTWEIAPNTLVDQNKIVVLSEINNEIRLEATAEAVIRSSLDLKVSGEDNTYGYFETSVILEVGELW